jgi:hypothetical protein
MSLDPFAPGGVVGVFEHIAGAYPGSVSHAPATIHDGLRATSPGMPGVEFGPMFWNRNGTQLPAVGDAVLIITPISGDPWAIWWAG